MARTIAHKPARLYYDSDGWWTRECNKHSNIKGTDYARIDRRLIRHAPIDEEGTALTNALAEYKRDVFARNRYW